jgi:hypothetical protein
METELSRFVNENVYKCIEKTRGEFPYLEIYFESPSTETSILKDSIKFSVNSPTEITLQDLTKKIRKYTFSLPIRLGYILDVRDEVIEESTDSNYLLPEKLLGYDLNILLSPVNENDFVYIIRDSESRFDKSDPFIFNFAVRQDFKKNNPPVIEDQGGMIAYVGEPFYTRVIVSDPDNDDLFFEDSSIMFDISDNGEIGFTPLFVDIGNYSIPITVRDSKYELTYQLRLNITER